MKEKGCTTHYSHHEEPVLALPCSNLVEHPLRLPYYNPMHLDGLTASIKLNGLLEPILVQPLDDGHYQLQENNRYGRPESYTEEDKVQVSVFPDFAIDLKPVFDSM